MAVSNTETVFVTVTDPGHALMKAEGTFAWTEVMAVSIHHLVRLARCMAILSLGTNTFKSNTTASSTETAFVCATALGLAPKIQPGMCATEKEVHIRVYTGMARQTRPDQDVELAWRMGNTLREVTILMSLTAVGVTVNVFVDAMDHGIAIIDISLTSAITKLTEVSRSKSH